MCLNLRHISAYFAFLLGAGKNQNTLFKHSLFIVSVGEILHCLSFVACRTRSSYKEDLSLTDEMRDGGKHRSMIHKQKKDLTYIDTRYII